MENKPFSNQDFYEKLGCKTYEEYKVWYEEQKWKKPWVIIIDSIPEIYPPMPKDKKEKLSKIMREFVTNFKATGHKFVLVKNND